MEQKKIDRISELTRKSRTPEGLTAAEETERAALRQEYLHAVLGSLEGQLSQIVIEEPDGTRHRLPRQEEKP